MKNILSCKLLNGHSNCAGVLALLLLGDPPCKQLPQLHRRQVAIEAVG